MVREQRHIGRQRILTGANRILESGVYGDLTVDALARELHMSKSTLYKHFASKDDVIVSLVDAACAETEAELSRVDTMASPEAALHALLEVGAHHAERLPRAAITQLRRLPSACQARVVATDRLLREHLQAVLEHGRHAGVFTPDSPVLATEALMASARAATSAAARGDLQVERGDAVRALLPLFLPGLEAEA